MKLIKSAMLAVGLLLLTESSVFAADGPGTMVATPLSLKSIGAGIIIVGAALGIGLLGRRLSRAWPASPRLPAISRLP